MLISRHSPLGSTAEPEEVLFPPAAGAAAGQDNVTVERTEHPDGTVTVVTTTTHPDGSKTVEESTESPVTDVEADAGGGSKTVEDTSAVDVPAVDAKAY